jgi:hypothetical protein
MNITVMHKRNCGTPAEYNRVVKLNQKLAPTVGQGYERKVPLFR